MWRKSKPVYVHVFANGDKIIPAIVFETAKNQNKDIGSELETVYVLRKAGFFERWKIDPKIKRKVSDIELAWVDEPELWEDME